MKRVFPILIAAGLALLILSAPVFGQSTAGGKKAARFTVTINTNVKGAAILVDGSQIIGNSASVAPGIHSVRVTATGYADFFQNFNVTSNMTINALLERLGLTLSVNANVPNATVFVDGSRIKGNTTSVAPGTHSVRVSAEGYEDYAVTVNVTRSMTVNAVLRAASFPLTVNADVLNAEIYVDGARINGNSVRVPAGMHTVRVSARGYEDYNASFLVTGPMVVSATLRSALHELTIRVNVLDSEVFIDGIRIKGSTARVAAGTHAVNVRAEGYQDYNATFDVNGSLVISVELQRSGFPLTVTANVPGAMVTFDNVPRGQVPYTEVVSPGTITVTVSAPGYLDYIATVAVTRPTTINARLQPGLVILNFLIPPRFQTPDREGLGLVRIMIDGKLMNPKKEVSGIQVSPGRHAVSVMSGGLAVELGDFDFSAGMEYTIELFMELRVRASAAAQ